MSKPSLKITCADQEWIVDVDAVTPREAAALRVGTLGAWRVPTLLAAVAQGWGPEELAGLIFLAGIQAEGDNHPTYLEVCELLEAADKVEVDTVKVEPDDEDDDPKA